MEEALRRAFMANRERQRQQQPEQYAKKRQLFAPGNIPIDWDGSLIRPNQPPVERRVWNYPYSVSSSHVAPTGNEGYVLVPTWDDEHQKWMWKEKQGGYQENLDEQQLSEFLGLDPNDPNHDTDRDNQNYYFHWDRELNPHELWIADLPGGEPPKVQEQDWRPDETMPEDFFANSDPSPPVNYGPDEERQSFEDLIDQNPLDSTNHLVFADWLQDRGEDDEAEFRRAMGEWMQKSMQGSAQGMGNNFHLVTKFMGDHTPRWLIHPDDLPRGIDHRDIRHVRGRQPDPPAARRYDTTGRFGWLRYPDMEQAFRQAFMANRERQRQNPTQAARYDDPQDENGNRLPITEPYDPQMPATEPLATAPPPVEPPSSDEPESEEMTDETRAYLDTLRAGANNRSFRGDLEGFMTFVPSPQREQVLDALEIPRDHPDPRQAIMDAVGHTDAPGWDDEPRISPEGPTIRSFVRNLSPDDLAAQLQFYGINRNRSDANEVLHSAIENYLSANVNPPSLDDPGHTTPERTALGSNQIVNQRPLAIDEKGVNASHLVDLGNGMQGIFKPSAGEQYMRQSVPVKTYHRREVASSLVADLLGLGDLVPKTAFRNDPQHGPGSIQQFVPGAVGAFELGERQQHGNDPQRMANAALFDYLIGQIDRHVGNWMIDPEGKPVLIDNGLTFPTEHHRRDYAHAKAHNSSEILRNAVERNLPVPDLSGAHGLWPAIERALKSAGIEDSSIALTKKRFDSLVAGKNRPFGSLPSYWHATVHAPDVPLKRYF